MATSAIQTQDQKLKSLGLTKTIVNDAQVCTYSRNLGSVSEKNPVLVLIHGYPESSYMWRHLIPLLPQNAPIFVPDLPGYGTSGPIAKNDKLAVGQTILSALQTQVKRSSSGSSTSAIPVILIGHDRGARVAHRLAVSGHSGINVLGITLIDIVPTITQWKASQKAAEVVTYFHWPFLAKVEQAKKMILAYGGDRWCEDMIFSWAGKNDAGLKSLKADGAVEVYKSFFKEESIVEASNKDYEAGATVDIDQQVEDQEKGRKIGCPLLLIYSEGYLGGRYDVPAEWADWVSEGVEIKTKALGNGIGHFGAEEAPKESAQAIVGWLKELGLEG
ncbi:Alpha/Beta hydrolase protein [Lophiotrema nucula]|uniref:Alpha/Beta hydrolase protein n=1 Tax=Lophiotrema nucula TaxID=690887 RepID=A0A6A5YRE1_9PLEO|nr:Alpha/Beta hydrolase protein [Lophiotrema nucula]